MEAIYPEIHNLHHDMDIELKPSLTEANVQTHTVLMDIMEKCRKLRPEDCCKYCAVYSNNLTSLRQKEIESWRQDVNRAAYPKRSATAKAKEVTYHKYTPPGRPDETEGFRRIRTPKKPGSKPSTALKKRSAKQPPQSNKKCIDLSLQTSVSKRKYNRDGTLIIKEPDRGIHSEASQRKSGTKLNQRAEVDVDLKSISDNNSEEMHARSTSNDLLNVMTIDDCKMLHDHKKAGMIFEDNSSVASGKSLSVDSFNMRPTTSVRFNVENQDMMNGTSTKSPLPPIPSENNEDDDEYFELLTEPNETIIRALDNIIQNKKVTNNRAKRGLFQHEKGCRPLLQDNNESNRFRKMNDNLHKVIEEKYLVNPKITDKIRKYHLRHQCDDTGDSSLDTATKLRVTTPEIRRERQQVRLESITTISNVSKHDSPEKQEAHESFLGMLMNIDESGRKAKKKS